MAVFQLTGMMRIYLAWKKALRKYVEGEVLSTFPGILCNIIFVLVLTIFNERAYLTFKSIFHKALNLV